LKTRRSIYAALLATAALSAIPTAALARHKKIQTLKNGEGLVVVSLNSNLQLGAIEFRRLNGDGEFEVGNFISAPVFNVPAGRYYPAKLRWAAENVAPTAVPKPTDLIETIDVKAGVVSYIGEWRIDNYPSLDLKVTFDGATVRRALNLYTFPGLDLYTVRVGVPPEPLAWPTAQ
jgi:hypothetical protein